MMLDKIKKKQIPVSQLIESPETFVYEHKIYHQNQKL